MYIYIRYDDMLGLMSMLRDENDDDDVSFENGRSATMISIFKSIKTVTAVLYHYLRKT